MLKEFELQRGLIPVALDEELRKIHWLDLDGFHFYQGFFAEGLRAYAGLRRSPPQGLVSGLEELPAVDRYWDSIFPSAFVFHAGRCGSTLLAKVLARSRDHMVFGEAGPHNQIWDLLPPDPLQSLDLYRRLILAMGRRRLPSYRAHIIKFTSFNILQAGFIRAAFPGVPCLFVFRRPDALLDSYRLAPPSWVGSRYKLVAEFDSAESAVAAFFTAALSNGADDFRFLDYDLMAPEALPGILRYLRLDPPKSDIPQMLNEFLWNSKSGLRPAPFTPRHPEHSPAVSPGLAELYRQMKERSFEPCSQRS